MEHKPSVVSLFSGAGGFDWGFHLAGFYTRFANELLPAPSQTLASNFQMQLVKAPATPTVDDLPLVVQGDVAQVYFGELNGFRPDVIIGGPPCQDFSTVQGQQRRGIEVKRGMLYSYFVRALTILQPKVFVFENVPGLRSANKGLAYETIIGDFQGLNEKKNEIRVQLASNGMPHADVLDYEILYNDVVDATRLGVPQTRKRLIIIGVRKDITQFCTAVEMDRIRARVAAKLTGQGKAFAKFPLTAIEAFEGKPLCELNDKYREVMEAYRGIWHEGKRLPAAQQWKDEVWDQLSLHVVDDYLRVNEVDLDLFTPDEFDRAMEEHERLLEKLGWLNSPVSGVEPSDRTDAIPRLRQDVIDRMNMIPPDENHEFVLGTEWSVKGKGISFIYRRPFPLKPAPTVVAYGGGGTYGYHYARNRTQLTLRERARIQTFTDNFLFSGNTSDIRAQIGEAVPPVMGRVIANAVREVLAAYGQATL